jgi:hypothetical protein
VTKLLENDFIASLWIVYNTQRDMSACLICKKYIIRNLNSSAHCVSLKGFLIMNKGSLFYTIMQRIEIDKILYFVAVFYD